MLKAKKPRVERQQGFLNSQELVSSLKCVRTFCSFYFGNRGEIFFSLLDVCTLEHRGTQSLHLQAAVEGVVIKQEKKAEAERRPDQFQDHRMWWRFSFKQQKKRNRIER